MSQGLKSRIIARSGQSVPYEGGALSSLKFHVEPDAGAIYPDSNASNPGGKSTTIY